MSEADTGGVAELHTLRYIDEFLVVERTFGGDSSNPTFGLANIHPIVPDIEANKSKILRATQIFKERKANIVLFPEFSLSGYFWDDEPACTEYMNSAALDQHYGWIETQLKPLLDENLREIVLNGLTRVPGGGFQNTTMVVAVDHDYKDPTNTYHKLFLPGIEKRHTVPGDENRLVIDSPFGRFGFTTCYDYLFSELLREYAFDDDVEAILQVACWRAAATRDYPNMNVRTDMYYGELWDMVMAASSAMHQVWTIACNMVGRHEISGAAFWGGSGIWAPSGLKLVQGSKVNEELLIVHDVDIKNQRKLETDDFNYAFDFNQVYRRIVGRKMHSDVE